MTSAKRALLGGSLLTGCLGSIHAFSVFIEPLELLLSASRSQVSALYSLALVCLTIAVWGGHHVYHRFTPATLAAITCIIAAAGLAITGYSQSLYGHLLGYSLLFGGANGIGYGLSLYVISRAMPERRGFGMGTVTAVYALGATLFVKIFERLIAAIGVDGTFFVMAGIVLCTAGAVAWLYIQLPDQHHSETGHSSTSVQNDMQVQIDKRRNRRLSIQLWFGYGLGVVAGLMAIGHAAGIVSATGASQAEVITGAMLIGIGNAMGGFIAGWLVDRMPARILLLILSLLSGAMLITISLQSTTQLALSGLTIIGFAYGAIIAIYPVATVTYYGPEGATKAYGQIFTAWGMAGLFGPWLAGVIYDTTGDYRMALALASIAALLSAGIVFMLPSERE